MYLPIIFGASVVGRHFSLYYFYMSITLERERKRFGQREKENVGGRHISVVDKIDFSAVEEKSELKMNFTCISTIIASTFET